MQKRTKRPAGRLNGPMTGRLNCVEFGDDDDGDDDDEAASEVWGREANSNRRGRRMLYGCLNVFCQEANANSLKCRYQSAHTESERERNAHIHMNTATVDSHALCWKVRLLAFAFVFVVSFV